MINNIFFSEKRGKSGFRANFSGIVLLINKLRGFLGKCSVKSIKFVFFVFYLLPLSPSSKRKARLEEGGRSDTDALN